MGRTIFADPRTVCAASAVAEARSKVDPTLEPPYRAEWSGEFQEMEDAEKRLARVFGVALILIALFLYLLFDGLVSLYIISALFGLFQGGIVPMYAIIVRQYFSPKEAGIRIGIVLMATLFGMALGGWMSGVIFDHTGSYRIAFLHGLIWNVLNAAIVAWLMLRPTRRLAVA